MYQVTGSALDQDEAIIANRVKSIQDQYAMVNELAAQAPMGIQSLHRPVEVPDVAPDPFYSSDAIRSTINTVSTHSHTLSTKYSDLFSQDDVSSLVRRAFDNPSLVTGSKKRLSTSASGSARRRPEKVEVTRKQKQDLELANAPLEFPTFKSVYDEDIAKPVTPERSEADEVSEHKKSKPPPMKRANSDSSEDKPHPKKLPTSTKVHTIYRGKSKPNNNKGRVVSPSSEETAKKKKKKTGKVAFGSTVKKTKDVIGRVEIKARKIGDTANELVKTVARAAEISARAAEDEILTTRRALEENEREMASLRARLNAKPNPGVNFEVGPYGQVSAIDEQENEYRVVTVSRSAVVASARSPGVSFDAQTVDTSMRSRSRSPSKSPRKSPRRSPRRSRSPRKRSKSPSIASEHENDATLVNLGTHKPSMHISQPEPIFINATQPLTVEGEDDATLPMPMPTLRGAKEFEWKNPNEVLPFMKDKEDEILDSKSQEHSEDVLPPPPVFHPVKLKKASEAAVPVTIDADADALLSLLINEALAEDSATAVLAAPKVVKAPQPSDDERFSRAMMLLEKTAETQRLYAERENNIAEREASLVKLEQSITEALKAPYVPLSPKKLSPPNPTSSKANVNPNSGSIQLSSSSGEVGAMGQRLAQGHAAPGSYRANQTTSSALVSAATPKQAVNWKALTLAPGASFEAAVGSPGVVKTIDYGDDHSSTATLVVPGTFQESEVDSLKAEMQASLVQNLQLEDESSVVVEDVRHGSILFDVRIVSDGAFSAKEKMIDLHDICNNGKGQGWLSRVVSVKDPSGNATTRFRTNLCRLLKGGETFKNLPLRSSIDASEMMEVGVGGWQINPKRRGKPRSYEAFEGESMDGISRERVVGSGSEAPDKAMGGSGVGGGVDLSMVVEEDDVAVEEEAPASPIRFIPPKKKFETNLGRLAFAGEEFQKQKLTPEKSADERKAGSLIGGAKVEEEAEKDEKVKAVEVENEEKEVEKEVEATKELVPAPAPAPAPASAPVKAPATQLPADTSALVDAAERGDANKVLTTDANAPEPTAAPPRTSSSYVEEAIRKERDAAKKKIIEMEKQLEETKRKLTEAEQNMQKQKNVIDREVTKRISKPPKLISVGAEFPDADYQLDSSCSDLDASTSTVDSDEMGIGFGVREEVEPPKPHQVWLQKAKQYYGISTSQSQPTQPMGAPLKMSEEKAFERRVIDGAEERNEFYRNNSSIIKGKQASTAHFDEGEDEENEENEGGYNAGDAAAPNPGVSSWLNRVKRLTGEAHEPPPFSFTEEHLLPQQLRTQQQRTPPRDPKLQQSMSPQHAYLERVAGILKEPGLSPKKRNPVTFSQQTIDFGSDNDDEDEDGSIRSLRTEEAFSPSTSFAISENSRMSRSFRFSKTVMSSDSIDTRDTTDTNRLSVDTSVSLESGQWIPKSKSSHKGKQKYYAQRLDESFESGKRFGGESSGSVANLSRAGRVEGSRWDRLYEEADSDSSGSSDY